MIDNFYEGALFSSWKPVKYIWMFIFSDNDYSCDTIGDTLCENKCYKHWYVMLTGRKWKWTWIRLFTKKWKLLFTKNWIGKWLFTVRNRQRKWLQWKLQFMVYVVCESDSTLSPQDIIQDTIRGWEELYLKWVHAHHSKCAMSWVYHR